MKFTFIPSDKAFIGLPPIIQAFLTLPANLEKIVIVLFINSYNKILYAAIKTTDFSFLLSELKSICFVREWWI
jgi:hypothetical protein